MEKPRIFLAMPLYNQQVTIRAAAAFYAYPCTRERFDLVNVSSGCSLLGRSFNQLWMQALNNAERGVITHFSMIHGDVGAQERWLDILMDELDARRADICSAVIPIKDMKGVTSTAIDDPDNPWQPYRRLTMHEIMQLPETFDAMDCFQAGLNMRKAALLVNTGCWVCDLRKPWVLGDWTQNKPVCFTINDRVYRGTDHMFWTDVEPEDWHFSRQAAQYGARVVATRKVKLEHWGEISWTNADAWGQWKYDEEILGPPETSVEEGDGKEPISLSEGASEDG